MFQLLILAVFCNVRLQSVFVSLILDLPLLLPALGASGIRRRKGSSDACPTVNISWRQQGPRRASRNLVYCLTFPKPTCCFLRCPAL